jgi:hypothetical protein
MNLPNLNIRKGDIVTFKPEFSDPGDEDIKHFAAADEDRGHVVIESDLGLPLNPQSTVHTDMIATVNGKAVAS